MFCLIWHLLDFACNVSRQSFSQSPISRLCHYILSKRVDKKTMLMISMALIRLLVHFYCVNCIIHNLTTKSIDSKTWWRQYCLARAKGGWGVLEARGDTTERKEKKNLNHHQRAGGAGSRTMTFNRRKPKQIFYKIAESRKSVTSVSRR